MNDKHLSLTTLSDENIEKINNYLDAKIDSYIRFKDIKKMRLCQRFFSTKPNQSYINSLEVLEFLIDFKSDLQGICDSLEDNKFTKSLINDALKILKCHGLIDQNEKKSVYYPTNKKWVKDARYKLKDKEILITLAELLLSFVKANIDNKPSNFFDTIDKLIEFILKRSVSHNVNYELEAAIYTAISYKKNIDVIIKATGKKIEIKPYEIKITFNQTAGKDSKDLIYSIAGTSQEKQISLSEIMLYSSHNAAQTSSAFAYSNPNPNPNLSNYLITQNIIEKEVKKTDVILAVNSILYEYFVNIDVFEEMEIITDSHAIKILQREFASHINENRTELKKLIFNHDSLTPSVDFFLLRIKDDYDFI
ncbi:MAG: hypothetical protein OEL19_10410, partial [Sulfurimonas sp.]|nr:hypothetical protein [Sulfurimonas sp.]